MQEKIRYEDRCLQKGLVVSVDIYNRVYVFLDNMNEIANLIQYVFQFVH